jgi:hypothetical protein
MSTAATPTAYSDDAAAAMIVLEYINAAVTTDHNRQINHRALLMLFTYSS